MDDEKCDKSWKNKARGGKPICIGLNHVLDIESNFRERKNAKWKSSNRPVVYKSHKQKANN